jgi:hypothetical protein
MKQAYIVVACECRHQKNSLLPSPPQEDTSVSSKLVQPQNILTSDYVSHTWDKVFQGHVTRLLSQMLMTSKDLSDSYSLLPRPQLAKPSMEFTASAGDGDLGKFT